jgi:hypothetical protein
MKQSKGKANPQQVNQMLQEKLKWILIVTPAKAGV